MLWCLLSTWEIQIPTSGLEKRSNSAADNADSIKDTQYSCWLYDADNDMKAGLNIQA